MEKVSQNYQHNHENLAVVEINGITTIINLDNVQEHGKEGDLDSSSNLETPHFKKILVKGKKTSFLTAKK